MITIITIAARKAARFAQMEEAILRAAVMADVEVEWIVVNEHPFFTRVTDSPWLKITQVKPDPSAFRPRLPDHNNARNTGLRYATGGYVVFLDDNCIPSERWLIEIDRAAQKGLGFRSHFKYVMRLDAAPKFTPEGNHLEKVPAKSVGGLIGAPKRFFERVQGFDEIYAGEAKFNDIDCAVRMERAGLTFVTSREACVFHLRDEGYDEISTRPYVRLGKANRKKWIALLKDKKRIHPIQPHPVQHSEAEALPAGTITLEEHLSNHYAPDELGKIDEWVAEEQKKIRAQENEPKTQRPWHAWDDPPIVAAPTHMSDDLLPPAVEFDDDVTPTERRVPMRKSRRRKN